MINLENIRLGIHGPLNEWLDFNRVHAFESEANMALVAPFPPHDRMLITTGLVDPKDFASHGYDVLKALNDVSPQPLSSFSSVLDFGVGAGRLARMFKGFKGNYTGIDVDEQNIKWINSALKYVRAIHTRPKKPLPFPNAEFDLVISVSVFSHMNENDHLFYLTEIARVTKPGACILLTTHGERALNRAENEDRIFNMLQVSKRAVAKARKALSAGGFKFIRQWFGHLSSFFYAYGITFISAAYVERVWSKYFQVISVRSGAIHDFQDIVVLKKI